ncbi:MAG: hypothetical protein IT289_11160 [Oligoflexia bacterium]|nr:hypothetical protein [Oligoflexia bacterium]
MMSRKAQNVLGAIAAHIVDSQYQLDQSAERSKLISDQVGTPTRHFVWNRIQLGFNISAITVAKNSAGVSSTLDLIPSERMTAGIGIGVRRLERPVETMTESGTDEITEENS